MNLSLKALVYKRLREIKTQTSGNRILALGVLAIFFLIIAMIQVVWRGRIKK